MAESFIHLIFILSYSVVNLNVFLLEHLFFFFSQQRCFGGLLVSCVILTLLGLYLVLPLMLPRVGIRNMLPKIPFL